MCGIAGLAHPASAGPVEERVVRVMCDRIRHRGPDDEGIAALGPVGLGMRRLSIIDLAGGHQPIYNEDRTKVIVFNGEIYNYRELRAELLGRGHRLATDSDTETIVHLYEEYGADCVTRLRGMFAFALWDATEGKLLLARDRFGIKPLYVAHDRGRIAFASELKSLTSAGLAGGDLDWEALGAFFRLGYIPAPYTPFAGVRKLEPGNLLIWKRDGTWTQRRYWDLPGHDEPEPRHVAERVAEWIDESVSAHLVSDVPLAVMLSGGLDSSAVFTSMARAGMNPHAYTARYHGSGAEATDESGLAAKLAQRYGARLTVVDVQPRVAELLEPIVEALDEPHADESAVPTWLLSAEIARDYKVVLAGTGGDELFGGYRRHQAMQFTERYAALPAALRNVLAGGAALVPEPSGGSLAVHRMKRFLRTTPGGIPERYFGLLDKLATADRLFSPDVAARAGNAPALERIVEIHREGGSGTGLRAPLYIDYKTYLPDDILHLSDRISMAHSLEVRVPFVDHRLVEKVFPLPDRTKMRLGRTKHLLRAALADRLTPDHFRAPKRGFVGPTAMWLRNELREMVRDELAPSRIESLGFFDAGYVQELIDDHMTRRHNREGVLWSLLTFSIWHRQNSQAPSVASVVGVGA